jgi:hypothetical protein
VAQAIAPRPPIGRLVHVVEETIGEVATVSECDLMAGRRSQQSSTPER